MPTVRNRKPGRPKGSATKADTVGKKRAIRYFELVDGEGMASSKAAQQAAEEFGTTPEDIFKSAKRYFDFVLDETKFGGSRLQKQLPILEEQVAAMRAVRDMGPHPLSGMARCLHLAAEAIKGNAI